MFEAVTAMSSKVGQSLDSDNRPLRRIWSCTLAGCALRALNAHLSLSVTQLGTVSGSADDVLPMAVYITFAMQRDPSMTGDIVRVHPRRGGQVSSREFWIGLGISDVLASIFFVDEPLFSLLRPFPPIICAHRHVRPIITATTSKAGRRGRRGTASASR